MKKRKYIAPETEVFHIATEGHLLRETRVGTGSETKSIIRGDLPSGVEVTAKPYSGWEDVGDNGSLWDDDDSEQ